MNTKTKQARPAANTRPATTTALAALLQRSTRAQRESYSKNAFQKRSALPPLHRIGEDGVDHINVAALATTELGQLLSTRQILPFSYDIFGQFNTIDNVLYYARSVHRDDMFRDLPPIKARARADREPMHPRLANFKAIGIDAMFQRIKQFPELLKAVVESTLPFDMYTIADRGMRSRPVDAEWIVEGLERIRKALRDKHTPLLLDYLDDEWRLPSNSVPIKAKLAHQRRVIRLQFMTEAELDAYEEQQAEEARQRAAEATARREARAAEAEASGGLDPATEADLANQEAQADAAVAVAEAAGDELAAEIATELAELPPVDLPADGEAIPGLHLTTDAVVEVVNDAGDAAVAAVVENLLVNERELPAAPVKTLVGTECKGPHLVNTYDDGSTEVAQLNDPQCGSAAATA